MEHHSLRNTHGRSNAEADISDIMDAQNEADRNCDKNLPVTFAAADLGKLLKYSPKEIKSVGMLHILIGEKVSDARK